MKNSLVIRGILSIWKYPLFVVACNQQVYYKLRKDIARRFYQQENQIGKFEVFCRIIQERNIASIFLARINNKKFIFLLVSHVFKNNSNIEILTPSDKIGAGLVVFHNLGAVIRAKSIGENVTISQGVTIGAGGGKNATAPNNIPTIGNNVLIATNSIVIGDITIGDNAVIGAGSVITKSVPSDVVVVGNPQTILKSNKIDQ